MKKKFSGKIWKLGDDVDTDIIIPTQWLTLDTMDEIKTHAFEPLRPELAGQIQPGDILVGGSNFGCGSSREQAPECISALQVPCIIAKSFARIFFRNAINNRLLLLESRELPDHCSEGDIVSVDLKAGTVGVNGQSFNIPSIPDNVFKIVADGGLVRHMQIRNRIIKREEK